MTMKNRFKELQGSASDRRERLDCTVKAWAVVADIPYADAHQDLAECGRRHGRRFALEQHLPQLLLKRGLQLRPVNFAAKTVATLGHALPSHGVFLAFVRGHVLGCRGGIVHDWTAGRRHRLLRVYRVSPR